VQAGDFVTVESNEDIEFALALSLDGSNATSSQPTFQVHLVNPAGSTPSRAAGRGGLPVTTTTDNAMSIHDLSAEITERIMGYLSSPKDLASASMTCKQWWSNLADGHSHLWQSLFQRLHQAAPQGETPRREARGAGTPL
jgi:hypothetical protein